MTTIRSGRVVIASTRAAAGIYDDRCGPIIVDWLRQQGFDAPPVHDLCCVAYLCDPDVFTTQEAFVAVELTGTWTTGMTVTDFAGQFGQPVNTEVAIRLDKPRLWDMTVEAIATLSARTAVAAR